MSVLVIAEAGVNHNGSLATALALVDAAAEAGADVVKFQTFRAAELATDSAPQAEYQKRNTGNVESQLAMLKRLELSEDDHIALIERCDKKGIEFLSTAFDPGSLDFLSTLKLKRCKIPSGEATNFPFLRRIGSLGREVILSTGMCSMREVEDALRVLEESGTPRERITVLHCTTDYPAQPDDVNLRAMVSIRDAFGVRVGYSDHTQGIEIAAAAVALGAEVIEKHFTLDRTQPGPDHKASLEPAELSQMIRSIRIIERALGDGVKRPGPAEMRNIPVARKSIVAARPIRSGELFSEENLAAKRPGTGISPMRWPDVLGHKARRDFAKDEQIEL